MENHQNNSKNNKPLLIKTDESGSLGLLALGHLGLRKWRADRQKAKATSKENKNE